MSVITKRDYLASSLIMFAAGTLALLGEKALSIIAVLAWIAAFGLKRS